MEDRDPVPGGQEQELPPPEDVEDLEVHTEVEGYLKITLLGVTIISADDFLL